MLVLLPPSEGKAEGARGRPLELDSLSLPELTRARETVLDELVALCRGDEDDREKAREVLGLSQGLRGEVVKNARLRTAPTLPAGEIYTGVLYDALGLATLDPAAKRRAARSLLVFSALWGAVGIKDRIPSYRLSGGVKLPGIGALGPYWRGPLESVLPEAAGGGLVLDLRSSAYAGMWKPKGDLARRTATVRVLQSRLVDGVEKRSVVSHFNKATKGRIVRALLETGAAPKTPAALAGTLRELGHVVEGDDKPGATALDVVVTEL
ncbi:peroxide stress protein YaaA [Streptomyces sp. A73]|uniref:peroxide stress protein YaaA n=1 Tax=Streptomyces TaxID=1883 RepID=UPI000C1A24C2|nr:MULTISPECIES: peroxide stress protein YaaA [unclassified Streptomyces]MBQ0863357.1 peroxide stress protein YaaA [Streptomyces sp. RK75]MBQ1122703.1 peroxide stress protein YaaA [Streptomyces sp. B15]MBQ1161901.1 peroxide stress protein YaaA [Streptomyces sp. A73]